MAELAEQVAKEPTVARVAYRSARRHLAVAHLWRVRRTLLLMDGQGAQAPRTQSLGHQSPMPVEGGAVHTVGLLLAAQEAQAVAGLEEQRRAVVTSPAALEQPIQAGVEVERQAAVRDLSQQAARAALAS